MLKNINPILSPDLLHIVASMGHGDELVIADANFPGMANAERFVRADGISATQILEAVLSLMPLDEFVEEAALTMEVVGDSSAIPEVVSEFTKIVGAETQMGTIERFAFYDRAEQSFAIVQTGERRLYGNIIIKKGVVSPD